MFDTIWNFLANNIELGIFIISAIGAFVIFLLRYFEKRTGIDTDTEEVIVRQAQSTVITKLQETKTNNHISTLTKNEHVAGFRVVGTVKKPEEPKEVIVETKENNQSETKENPDEEDDSHPDNIINPRVI